ncbi:MAG TPA: gamma-glutamyl-gamma-aminobutyrate hydrolase family protein [Chthoniobacterales bacterium]|nr:gamma-glutamyl-gamma-aminobutyrate hydrolase family protein [Chthoniobacterales bacterium]
MPKLATWLRQKDERFFQPFFAKHPEIEICNALKGDVPIANVDGLLLTGGSDIAPEFLKQPILDPSVLEDDVDPARDKWEFAAVDQALARGLAVFAICKGMQVFNVALGGTLKLDIPGHKAPEQKENDVQELRSDSKAMHRFEKVNSSHHQAVDSLGEGLEVEAWCAGDDIIEQIRLRNYPFALGVQYHPERGKIYDGLFEDFFSRLNSNR